MAQRHDVFGDRDAGEAVRFIEEQHVLAIVVDVTATFQLNAHFANNSKTNDVCCKAEYGVFRHGIVTNVTNCFVVWY